MIYPIYVPSKGRPAFKTLKHLKELKCEKYLVIEPQDFSDYKQHDNDMHLIILPENNQGIAYARQVIKLHAEQKGYTWFWMIDDDIQNFHKIQADAKLKNTPAGFSLHDAQEMITSQKKIAVGSLNFGQYAFGEGVLKKPMMFNRRCIICTLNNTDIQRKFSYDLNCKLKEDIDFSLQLLVAGYRTAICNGIAITVPENASLKGGCYDEYQRQTNERAVSKYLEDKWGKDILRVVLKKNGRYDVKINWDKFK